MGRNLICDMDHVEVAQWIVGETTSGDQIALCNACFTIWAVAQLDATAPDEVKAAVVERWGQRAAAMTEEPAAAAGKSPRRRRAPSRVAGPRPRPDPAPANPAPAAGDQEPSAQGVARPPATPDDG